MTRHDMGGGSMGIPKIHAGLLFFFSLLLQPETSTPRYLCNNRRNGWGETVQRGHQQDSRLGGQKSSIATLC